MVMQLNQFYSVVLKKKIMIPASAIKKVVKKGRHFMVGKYKANGKTYEAWKVVAKGK